MNNMYNVSFKVKFRIISLGKGTRNRKIFAEYGEGVSKITGNQFIFLKLDNFRIYKKDVINLKGIQHELLVELFYKTDSRLKNYLKSSKNNILGLETCRILKYKS